MEGEIIYLNVGGTRFCTSKQTLTWIPDTFFTSLLSGRILSLMDESGAIFIDRDPQLFSQVLNFLRTKEVSLKNVDLKGLHDEAQYYGITPLVWRLALCGDLDVSSCGDALFHECIQPPVPPNSIINSGLSSSEGTTSSSTVLNSVCNQEEDAKNRQDCMCSLESRPGASTGAASYDMKHSRSSPDAVDSISNTIDSGGGPVELLCVMMVKGHYNWICASYSHFICLYRMIDLMGWQLAWTSGYLTQPVVLVAINARLATSALESIQQMVAATFSSVVRLWSITEDGDSQDVGVFNMDVSVDYLFFIGSQLVALSQMGKVGVWHSMTQHWRTQDVAPISSYEVAGTFLLLGCQNGSIYYIDMQKFPLRMKDNDLLVTELYKDQTGAVVTALSVYLAPKTVSNGGLSGNWLEVAYGTSSGAVRVIVHHPETAGHEPKLFQTFLVHRSPITKVVLSKKHLISVCSDYNHVRTWSVTRFRGLISTQPGSKPLASFKVVSLEDVEPPAFHSVGNHFGPYGEQDDMQVFVQKVVPHTDRLFIRMAYSGQRFRF